MLPQTAGGADVPEFAAHMLWLVIDEAQGKRNTNKANTPAHRRQSADGVPF